MSQSSSLAGRPRKLRLVCISDTHNHAPGEGYTLPKGDILIHAGDLTNQGNLSEVKRAAQWLQDADFAIKIVVAGNHDLSLDEDYHIKHSQGWTAMPEDAAECRRTIRSIPGIIYLEHESVAVDVSGVSMTIFGSPFTVEQRRQNWAFQYLPERGKDVWATVPDDIDVMITHTPPKGYVDSSTHWPDGGCSDLTKAVHRIKPRLMVCGHHHEGRGAVVIDWAKCENGGSGCATWIDPGQNNKKQSLLDLTRQETTGLGPKTAIVNASIMQSSWSSSKHKSFNKAIVVDLLVSPS